MNYHEIINQAHTILDNVNLSHCIRNKRDNKSYRFEKVIICNEIAYVLCEDADDITHAFSLGFLIDNFEECDLKESIDNDYGQPIIVSKVTDEKISIVLYSISPSNISYKSEFAISINDIVESDRGKINIGDILQITNYGYALRKKS